MRYSILIVDDEESVLKSIRRQLVDEPYDLALAVSGAQGLEQLARQPFHLIVSDMRMPEMDGVTFLRQAAELQPHAVRMVLSGYAEVGSILEAINQGRIWRYITKPWKTEDLKTAIRNGLDLWNSEEERRRLVEELKLRNAQLTDLNAVLEEKVRERTWELHERAEILNLILDDVHIDEVLERSLGMARKLSGAPTVALNVDFESRFLGVTGAGVSARARALLDECRQSGQAAGQGGELALPLTKGGVYLGGLVLEGLPGCGPEVRASLESLAALIAMALSLHKLASAAPELMGEIDKLLGEL